MIGLPPDGYAAVLNQFRKDVATARDAGMPYDEAIGIFREAIPTMLAGLKRLPNAALFDHQSVLIDALSIVHEVYGRLQ